MDITGRLANGLKVVGLRPVAAPVKNRADGSPIYYTRVVELILEDHSTILGCTECDFVADRIGVARMHLRRAHPKPDGPHRSSGQKPDGDWQSVTLGQAVAAAGMVDRLIVERHEWQQRARSAERDLAAIRKALKGVTS